MWLGCGIGLVAGVLLLVIRDRLVQSRSAGPGIRATTQRAVCPSRIQGNSWSRVQMFLFGGALLTLVAIGMFFGALIWKDASGGPLQRPNAASERHDHRADDWERARPAGGAVENPSSVRPTDNQISAELEEELSRLERLGDGGYLNDARSRGVTVDSTSASVFETPSGLGVEDVCAMVVGHGHGMNRSDGIEAYLRHLEWVQVRYGVSIADQVKRWTRRKATK